MLQATSSAAKPASKRSERGVGLLVVEDEATVRQEFGNYLRDLGFFVRVARSGKEAIRLAASPEIDIVLLDLVMPRLHGLDAGREIQGAHPEKAIIVVSHFIDRESRAKAKNLGLEVMEWVDKPGDEPGLQTLLAAIERTIEQLEKRRVRQLLESDEARGLEPERVLRLVKRWQPDLPDRVVEDLTREIGAHGVESIAGLRASLDEIRARGVQDDIQERQLSFGPFKQAILAADFWKRFEHADRNHRRVAMQLRMATRQLSSLDLEAKHLAALDLALQTLAKTQVSDEDVRQSERALRHEGIETLIDLGAQREQLLDIYREEAD